MVTHGIENQFTTRILPLEDATSVPPQGAVRALSRCGCHGVLRPRVFGVAPPVFNPHRGIHTGPETRQIVGDGQGPSRRG